MRNTRCDNGRRQCGSSRLLSVLLLLLCCVTAALAQGGGGGAADGGKGGKGTADGGKGGKGTADGGKGGAGAADGGAKGGGAGGDNEVASNNRTCKEFLGSHPDLALALKLYLSLDINLLGFHIFVTARVGGLQQTVDKCKGNSTQLSLLARHSVIPNSKARNADDLVTLSLQGALLSLANRRYTCWRYLTGIITINGGIVLEIHVLADAVVILVSLVGHPDAPDLEHGLAIVGLRLNLGALLNVVLNALKELLFGNGPHKCNGCTVLLPSNERLELLSVNIQLALAYTLKGKYYPTDFLLLDVVVNLLGVRLAVKIIAVNLVQIGLDIIIDLSSYCESDEALIYSRPRSELLVKIADSLIS